MISHFISSALRRVFPVFLLLTLSFFCMVLCSSCNFRKTIPKEDLFIEDTRIYLDTVTKITLYGTDDREILDDAFQLIAHYQDIFSRTQENTEVYRFNHFPGLDFPLSDSLYGLMEKALSYGKMSEGAFDISIAPVSSLWDFNADNPSVPDSSLLIEGLSHVDYTKLSLKGHTLHKEDPYMQIDTGGIAKGYIADKLKEYLLSKHIKSALINLGGNVLCVGEKADGSPFQIAVEKPFSSGSVGILEIKDLSVVTSGIYERCFEQDGILYHHILDSSTGYPVKNNLLSVTIISKNSTDADALSTSCFVLGLDKGMKLINSLPETHALFITDDYKLHYSKDFSKAVKLKENVNR